MADHEEMKLTVTLDDKISSKLSGLRNQLIDLHNSSTRTSLDRFNRFTKELSGGVKSITESAVDATKSMGPAGVAVGGVATAIGVVGIALYNTGKQLREFSQQALSLETMAKTLGILPGQFKSLSRQLAAVMSPEQADQAVFKFGKMMQEYGRLHSEARVEWLRDAGFREEALKLLDQVTGLNNRGLIDQAMQTYIDAVNKAYEENVKTIGPVQAALQRRKALEKVDLPVDVVLLKDRLHAAGQDEIDDANTKVNAAKQFNEEWNKTLIQVNEFSEKIQLSIIEPFTKLGKAITGSGDEWETKFAKEVKDDVETVKTLYGIIKSIYDLVRPKTEAEAVNIINERQSPSDSGGFWSSRFRLPGMQHGGIVNQPTVAMIGEAGPEAVIPLSGGGQFWQNWPQSQNIEDRRQKTLEENTNQLRAINAKLDEEGGGQRYGMLSTGDYGAGIGTGAGTGPSGQGQGQGKVPGTTGDTGTTGATGGTGALAANDFIAGMVKRGWSKEAAAAMAGNIAVESNFNPKAVGDRGTSFGIVQWHGERAAALRAYAAQTGRNWQDREVQMDFLNKEFRQRFGDDAVKSTNMPQLEAMGKRFEGYSTSTYSSRVAKGRRYLQDYKEPTAPPVTPPTTPPPAAATPPASSTPAPVIANPPRGKMLFLHGMESLYEKYGGNIPQTEADARRIAAAKGLDLEVIPISGDVATRAAQEKEARARLDKDPTIKGVLGFSQGGYLAGRLRKDYPGKEFTIVSASNKIPGNIQIPGVGHMGQLGAMATLLEQQAKASAIANPNKGTDIDRNVLDATLGDENTRSVEGTGKVKVDVEVKSDAPKRRSPVFKDVTTDRPRQMIPAPEGKKFGEATLNESGAV